MTNRHTKRITLGAIISLSLVLMVGMFLPGDGYAQIQPGEKRMITDGEKATIKGVILSRDGETFTLRELSRKDTVVVLTDTTKIRTERKGLFRGNKPFDVTALLPGLILQAEGKGDAQGRLVAEDIQFSETDLKAAITSYAQTAPVSKKLEETNKELSATNKELAETGKEVAETNKRISMLDSYDVVKTVSILFPVNGAKLGTEQKAQLDELASKAPGAKNYTVEVKGFTDSTGDFQKNIDLSRRRALSVVEYLAVKHNIPLRRITVPMGYGETKLVSKDKTAADRKMDRRVEVSVLVNKGLTK